VRPSQCRLDRPPLLHQSQRAVQIALILRAFLDRAAPERAFRLVARLIRGEHRQRHFPLAEIVAHCLAQSGLVGGVIQRVVHQLERDPQIHAERRQRVPLARRAVGDHRADLARGGEQSGGLALDDLQILVLGGGEVVLRLQLQHLALGDRRGGARQDAQHDQRAVLDHQLERAREQEIADQHGRLVAEDRVGGGEAAAQLALIHHVVVQQRRGVDELHASRQIDVARAVQRTARRSRIAAQPRRRQGQQGPQPLAAGRHDMRRELRDQGNRAVHPRDDGPVAGLKIVADQLHQSGKRVFASARRNGWNGDGLSRARTGEAAQRRLLHNCFREAGHHIGAVENGSSSVSVAGHPAPEESISSALGIAERDGRNQLPALATWASGGSPVAHRWRHRPACVMAPTTPSTIAARA